MNMKHSVFAKRALAGTMAVVVALTATACGSTSTSESVQDNVRVGNVNDTAQETVQMYSSSPMIPDNIDWQDSASGQLINYVKTVEPNMSFAFENFSAENATITYDEACTQRIRDNVGDDIVMVNSDVLLNLGREGQLADLSDVDGIDHLIPAIKEAVTVNGKLVAFPWEYIAYGLIVNNDILKAHGLEIPETTEDFLACCEKLKADGMEIPMAANRWWLECFVLTQGFADFYQADNTDQLIADLNNGTTKMSEYMRPGFEFLKTCIDKGYINAEQAASYEAFDERDAYLAQESAFMTSFTSAVTGQGRKLNSYDFDLRVVGFPTDDGQVALISATGLVVPAQDKNLETAKKALSLLCSAEGEKIFCEKAGSFPTRDDVTTSTTSMPVLEGFMDDINANRTVTVTNPSINMELWGNTCTVVQDLLAGATVDECMANIDQMQADANAAA